MKKVRCVEKNLTTHPAFLRDREYELIEDFIWRGTRYFRVRLPNGTEVDADPYDFVVIDEDGVHNNFYSDEVNLIS